MTSSQNFTFSLLSFFLLCSLSGEVDFVRDVQPILEHNCVSCHREDNDKGGVRLDNKKVAFAGDDVIIPGNPEDSSLYWTTTLPVDDELFMPPIKNEEKDYPLTDPEKKILFQWIKEGAKWPEGVELETRKRLPKQVDFAEHVQPILELNCVACHYDGKIKGDLRLDSFEHAFASDHIIVPGEPLKATYGCYALSRKTMKCLCPLKGTTHFLPRTFSCSEDGLRRVLIGRSRHNSPPKEKLHNSWHVGQGSLRGTGLPGW